MNKKKIIKIYPSKGILFWVTGLAGTGKTSISKLLKIRIEKKFGPTIVLSGDDLRKIFNLNSYDKKSRLEVGKKYSHFLKKITDQKINIIFAVIGMFSSLRQWNKKNIKNYVEIFIMTNLKILKKNNKKNLYSLKKNVVGIDIKSELPDKPDIKIINSFKVKLENLSNKIFEQINKKTRFENEK